MSKQIGNAEAERLGISEETMKSMWEFFLKNSLPQLVEQKRKEQEIMEALEIGEPHVKQKNDENMQTKRRVRGAKALSTYLDTIGCPMSETTIFKLLREKRIPAIRPSDRILLFDLDAIDKWLTVENPE